MNPTLTCPDCKGKGRRKFVTTAGLYNETCVACLGTGVANQWQLAKIARGQELRRRRIEAGQTVRDTAHALGFTPVGLSNIETGRATDGIERYEAYLNEIEEAKA